jgi:hypothetical protein
MALENLIWNGLQDQLNILRSVTKAIINPAPERPLRNVFSLFSVLGVATRSKTIKHANQKFKPIEIPIKQDSPPVETVKGIGKKLGATLRTFGIKTITDLKNHNPATYKIPGISSQRIQKWQNAL